MDNITTNDVNTGTGWLSARRPVARKTHRCDCCGRDINPGERYFRGAMIDYDGDFQEVKHHLTCG